MTCAEVVLRKYLKNKCKTGDANDRACCLDDANDMESLERWFSNLSTSMNPELTQIQPQE